MFKNFFGKRTTTIVMGEGQEEKDRTQQAYTAAIRQAENLKANCRNMTPDQLRDANADLINAVQRAEIYHTRQDTATINRMQSNLDRLQAEIDRKIDAVNETTERAYRGR
jgi:hypothetical protein